MKTKLLLIVILFPITAICQDYFPMLNNSSWHVLMATQLGPSHFSITPDGQATFNGITYNKYIQPYFGEVYLREDVATKKVYKFYNNADVLLFDFSLQAGSIVTLANGVSYYVESITNINVVGGQRKKFFLYRMDGFGFNETWIEGVGNIEHPVSASYELVSDPVFYLECSSQNNTPIYNRGLADGTVPTNCASLSTEDFWKDDITISPNPFKEQVVISSSSGFINASYCLYNSLGQIVKESPRNSDDVIAISRDNLEAGVYYLQITQDGKKCKVAKICIAN
ncbi:T9SS type A sorting domain-containing protein [Flavobacterium orientale]|uniref:Secretion system C-terminal sorting domain-containing protein n=1 Tax=Flavobacterium orientale TaxID=1756020 RepID=A0A916Y4H5_9FLAO|nr:T9SS type A sorting domain-containing protein [Flavobacterium orientale]GGD30633.1 hypothetical protein GCM10011343_20980 [Flavobacterium orientale]